MLGKQRWLSIVLIASLATVGLGLSAGADSASEAGFLAKINASRSAQGLAPLSVDGGLRAHARNHTQDMIDSDSIFHSTSAELKAAAGSGWSKLGENVGRGGTVDSLHVAPLLHAHGIVGCLPRHRRLDRSPIDGGSKTGAERVQRVGEYEEIA